MISRRSLLASATIAALSSNLRPALSMTNQNAPARYSALALQTVCDAVNQDASKASAHKRMSAAIDRVTGQIGAAKGFFKSFNGYDLKLVVLPEYWMTGFPLRETREEWQSKAVIDMEGKLSERIAGIAAKLDVFLCSNHYENDPNFPNLYFQANVVYDPNGDTLLRYRRLVSLYSPSPYDVWDQYLDVYGPDAIFPTADTEIGVLGTIASEEILYPELSRMVTLNGAEIILHPTSEVGAPGLTPKDIAKRARAFENIAYVVSANSGEIIGTPVPAASTDGMSKIVDFKGLVMAEAAGGETMNANAILDIGALRETRRKTGMSNTLSRLPFDALQKGYGRKIVPANRTPNGNMIERAEALAAQRNVIERLVKDGVIK